MLGLFILVGYVILFVLHPSRSELLSWRSTRRDLGSGALFLGPQVWRVPSWQKQRSLPQGSTT